MMSKAIRYLINFNSFKIECRPTLLREELKKNATNLLGGKQEASQMDQDSVKSSPQKSLTNSKKSNNNSIAEDVTKHQTNPSNLFISLNQKKNASSLFSNISNEANPGTQFYPNHPFMHHALSVGGYSLHSSIAERPLVQPQLGRSFHDMTSSSRNDEDEDREEDPNAATRKRQNAVVGVNGVSPMQAYYKSVKNTIQNPSEDRNLLKKARTQIETETEENQIEKDIASLLDEEESDPLESHLNNTRARAGTEPIGIEQWGKKQHRAKKIHDSELESIFLQEDSSGLLLQIKRLETLSFSKAETEEAQVTGSDLHQKLIASFGNDRAHQYLHKQNNNNSPQKCKVQLYRDTIQQIQLEKELRESFGNKFGGDESTK